jgi:RND family efflux transporter MFP subunit
MEFDTKNRTTTVVHTVNRRGQSTASGSDSDPSSAIDGQLQKKLLHAVSNSDRKPVVIELVVGSLREVVSPAALLYVDRDASQTLRVPDNAETLERLPPGAVEKLWGWANETCQSGSAGFHRLSGAHQWKVVTVPVIFRNRPPEVLCAVFREDATSDACVVSALQLGASHITLWYILQEARQAKTESKNTSALLELLSSLDNSEDLITACYMLVNDLRDFLGCGRIALGLTRTNRVDCRLTAVSGLSDFDRRSEFTQQVEAALNEAVLKEEVSVVTGGGEENIAGTLAHQRLRETSHSRTLLSAPLYRAGGEVVGAWVFFAATPLTEGSETVHFVRASQQLVGSRLWMLRRAQGHPLMRPVRALFDGTVHQKAILGLLSVVFAVAVMMMPMNYRFGCQCQLEPVSRRFVAAPYDGTLEESMVKAGEIVSAGQVLARMDARELRWELTGLEADYKSEQKKRDAASARDEVAVAQQANFEMQRLSLKMQLLQHRLDNLEVKSPISGVVITGDLKRSEGAPLTIGQTMFEIGPLDEMIVEVAVPEREILYVKQGMQVHIRLDADQSQTQTGTVVRISPRSETRENESVYIAEVHIDNMAGLYRPGMKGTARVVGEPHALGWNLFHKAWESFAMWIGC